MKIANYPAETRSAFAVWQMFRGFGFDSDSLYVGIVDGHLYVQVKNSSGFSVSLGRTRMDPEHFGHLWADLAIAVSTWPEKTIRENYYAFVTPERVLTILAALDVHGIRIPEDPRRKHLN